MSSSPVHEFDHADFLVRSYVDRSTFAVNRAKLEDGSHVFRDMFSCCDASAGDANPQVLDLHEPESALSALLRLIHSPPAQPVRYPREPIGEKVNTQLPIQYDRSTAIPLPVLRVLFCLVDKYALSDQDVLESLQAHLLANAPGQDALTVYGLSLALDMPYAVSSEASQYLLPLAWYSPDEIKAIPTVTDYHNVNRLQAFRVKALQDILLRENLFPHGYGKCPTHSTSAVAVWERTRLLLAPKIETNTDVAGEMESLVYIFQSCSTCCKAFNAAVDMLAYKCRRVPRRLDQLPDDF
ncbi:hypothetical protein C8F04DRAFT_945863 [Mycena alexandri]|uniref:BTB domain-containing protein n=1 Tax=Mycena alexandri TaxID=1745969 RepID=A0AAD6TA23_9AGAR|nr:hypothetical protein C8F04DRAFT_945863 [Mycena alexandri]